MMMMMMVDVYDDEVIVFVVVFLRDVFCFFGKNVETVTNRNKKSMLDREQK